MDANRDFSELLSGFNVAGVRYLVVGAHALAFHDEPRFTKDLDIWVESGVENATRVWGALHRFGAPLKGINKDDFSTEGIVYQMGVPPNRIDVLTGISGVRFEAAWKRRVKTSFGGVPIHILGRSDLIRNKRASGRPQDLLDVQSLTKRRHRAAKRRR